MEDGLYKVQFRTALGDGGGVLIKVGDRVSGGDSGYAWTGHMSETGGHVTALLQVFRHDPSIDSVFGPLSRFELRLQGTALSQSAVLTGVTAAAPGRQIAVSLAFLVA